MAVTHDNQYLHEIIRQRLGPETILASDVNGQTGTWIGFDIHDRPHWLLLEQRPPPRPARRKNLAAVADGGRGAVFCWRGHDCPAH